MAGQEAKSRLVDLCHIDELPADGAKGFDLRGNGRDSLFVLRHNDALRGYFNICPHQGASLPWQKDRYMNADGTRIVCHAHGAEFDPDDGKCLRGAALGHSLFPVELSVANDGTVQARVGNRDPGDS